MSWKHVFNLWTVTLPSDTDSSHLKDVKTALSMCLALLFGPRLFSKLLLNNDSNGSDDSNDNGGDESNESDNNGSDEDEDEAASVLRLFSSTS